MEVTPSELKCTSFMSYCPCDLCDTITNHNVILPLRSRKLLDPVTRYLFVYMGVLCDFGPDKCGC